MLLAARFDCLFSMNIYQLKPVSLGRRVNRSAARRSEKFYRLVMRAE
jgi:hypothetical protein